MTQLPGASSAMLDDRKITAYLLDPTHPKGGAKAKFFSAFGLTLANWSALKTSLLAHPVTNSVTGQTPNAYGMQYEVTCSLATPDGRDPCIKSVWVILDGDTVPQLITAYP